MRRDQLTAGLIAHSLLYSIDHTIQLGKKPRAKLANAFKTQFKRERATRVDYDATVDEADAVFKRVWGEIVDDTSIALPKVIYFMVIQNGELFKPYKINKKHLEALNRAAGIDGLTFDSLKVSKKLISGITRG